MVKEKLLMSVIKIQKKKPAWKQVAKNVTKTHNYTANNSMCVMAFAKFKQFFNDCLKNVLSSKLYFELFQKLFSQSKRRNDLPFMLIP
jgi:hypothetical protein